MDVRCEKCQTEYELDESRLKPGGVTVKCTNCGHMFKIRKRTTTNVGAPAVGGGPVVGGPMARSGASRADSMLDEEAPTRTLDEGPTTVERQWVIRLENGEQKTCRELATLQQWIVSNIIGRESLISRSGKTWKRLGDIPELAQYFEIADEARTTRDERATKQTKKPAASTMLGVGTTATAAGGTILPDDDDETDRRSTGNFRSNNGMLAHRPPMSTPPPVPRTTKTPPMGSGLDSQKTPPGGAPAPRRPLTQPPGPPPGKKSPTGPVPVTRAQTPTPPPPTRPPPPDGRSTALWANDPIKATGVAPSGPFVGKLAAIPDEPAFTGPGAGRIRMQPSDEASFETGKVGIVDDEDDMYPRRSGSRAGLLVLLMMLLVGAGAAAVVYVFVIKKNDREKVATPADAGLATSLDATLVVTPVIDAPDVPAQTPIDVARAELGPDNEPRLRGALQALPNEPATQAVRAHLGAALAQDLADRAGLVADKAEADKLRKESKTIVLEAATAAQHAYKAAPDDAAANIAMAHVLRLQNKPAKELQRYFDAAQAKPGDWALELALAKALVLARDGKLDDARTAFEAVDKGEGKLETSNDVRARFHLALIALAQNRVPDSKAAVDQLLAAQPEHPGAQALAAKLETKVAATDPLPPEDPKGSGTGKTGPGPSVDTGGGYDQLLARANKLAETNCSKALELYGKALEEKPNGVEALTGQGYCHIDAKQFASAFSKFRSALAISSRYEPALWGIAEAYQQQGRREQALEAYQKYLDTYPDSAKAKKQIERLTGSGSGTPPVTPDAGAGSAATPPTTPPTPPTTPPATPEGAGSGG